MDILGMTILTVAFLLSMAFNIRALVVNHQLRDQLEEWKKKAVEAIGVGDSLREGYKRANANTEEALTLVRTLMSSAGKTES